MNTPIYIQLLWSSKWSR